MIHELKTLVAIARHGTHAAAAAYLHVTPAAVSAQMKRLESEIGFPLFDREGRGATLNARGRQVLLQAADILALYAQLGDSRPTATRRRLTVGAITSVQCSLLPRAIAALDGAHPNCTYRVMPGLSIELLDRLDAGELDMAAIIRPPFVIAPHLQWTTLVREPFVVIAHERRAGGGGAIDLLTHHPFIRYDRNSFGGRQVDRFLQKKQLAVDERFEIDELDAITELVELDLGVAMVPSTLALSRRSGNVRVVGLEQDTFHREIGCAFKTAVNDYESMILVHALIDSLRQVVDST